MTQTTSLHNIDRSWNYYQQCGDRPLTPRQLRRMRHKANRRLNR